MTGLASEKKLAELQQWFYTSITHPAGVRQGAAEAASSLMMKQGGIRDVVKPSATLNAADRLAIYHNAYFLRLVGVLEAEYPALKLALGNDLFTKFALFYLQQNPPASYTLYELSARLPDFLKATVPQENVAEAWPDFIIDLVKLERMFQEVYRGHGTEGISLLTLTDWKQLSPALWSEYVLQPAPCLRLMQSTFPVHQFLLSARHKTEVPLPEPHQTWLAVNRINYHVKIYELQEEEYFMLNMLSQGQGLSHVDKAFSNYMEKWLQEGFFLGIKIKNPHKPIGEGGASFPK